MYDGYFVRLHADFGRGYPSVKLIEGDKSKHALGIRHVYVISYDENECVKMSWYFEDTNHMHFIEAYWRFYHEVENVFKSYDIQTPPILKSDFSYEGNSSPHPNHTTQANA